MTAASVALGLRAKYPLQAARALAFHRFLSWTQSGVAWGEWLLMPEEKRVRHLTFWTEVCRDLDKEPSNVC